MVRVMGLLIGCREEGGVGWVLEAEDLWHGRQLGVVRGLWCGLLL